MFLYIAIISFYFASVNCGDSDLVQFDIPVTKIVERPPFVFDRYDNRALLNKHSQNNDTIIYEFAQKGRFGLGYEINGTHQYTAKYVRLVRNRKSLTAQNKSTLPLEITVIHLRDNDSYSSVNYLELSVLFDEDSEDNGINYEIRSEPFLKILRSRGNAVGQNWRPAALSVDLPNLLPKKNNEFYQYEQTNCEIIGKKANVLTSIVMKYKRKYSGQIKSAVQFVFHEKKPNSRACQGSSYHQVFTNMLGLLMLSEQMQH